MPTDDGIILRRRFQPGQRPNALGRETDWCKYLASKWLSEQKFQKVACEVKLACEARVDIVTETHAIEVDWVKKWPEAIGQAIYYARILDLKPRVVLLIKKNYTEKQHILRAEIACMAAGIELVYVDTT